MHCGGVEVGHKRSEDLRHRRIWVALLALFLSSGSSQIINQGSISWVHFDNITIEAPTGALTYTMWTMPVKEGWTGLIGLNFFTDNTSGLDLQVYYTFGVNTLPPAPRAYGAGALPGKTTQIPAFGGSGDDEWHFLFAATPFPRWNGTLVIGIYIIELQAMKENETSVPISLLDQQQFLYKVEAVGPPFKEGDTVEITASPSKCTMKAALRVGEIPQISDAGNFNSLVYLSQNGTELFYVIQLSGDCNGLTVQITRIPPIITISPGSQISLSEYKTSTRLLMRTAEPYIGLQVVVNISMGEFLTLYGSSTTFSTDDADAYQFTSFPFNGGNGTFHQWYSPDLNSYYWYYQITTTYASTATIFFQALGSSIEFGVPNTVQREVSQGLCTSYITDKTVKETFQFSKESYCACYSTNWNAANYYGSMSPSRTFSEIFPGAFVNPNNPTDQYALRCIMRPANYTDNMILSLDFPFQGTSDTEANITFYNVEPVFTGYGTELTFSSDTNNNGMFYIYANDTDDLAFITNGTTYFATVHVSAPSLVAGVLLEFSAPVNLTGSAGEFPAIGSSDPDKQGVQSFGGVNRLIVEGINIASIIIPVAADAATYYFGTTLFTPDLFAIVTLNSLVPVTVTAKTIAQTTLHFNQSLEQFSFKVPTSPEPQIYYIPYYPALQTISTGIDMDNSTGCIDGNSISKCVLFGSGGLQTIPISRDEVTAGMHVLPIRDFYYASNFTNDYYLLVYSNSPSFTLTVVPAIDRFLCDPVLLCSGHGTCAPDRSIVACSCLKGTGYSFSGFYCETRNFHLFGLFFVVFTIMFYFGFHYIFLSMRKGTSNRPETHSLINSSLWSDLLSSHLINTSISMNDVEFAIGSTTLLKGINLHISSGEFTAVIGPSGAGKSTIMKVLSGRAKPTSGTVSINGSVVPSLGDFRSLIGYVPQEDVINPLLTVRENIAHSALMRLPSGMPKYEKIRMVDAVIEALGLTEKKDVIVGDLGGRSSLSGGQRKRVSIALELVMCPSILLLDEPTSGLDSKTALSLVTLLKDHVAPLGINIIAVVHQPRYEILEACNNLIILANGELKYFGKSSVSELSESFPRLHKASPRANIADLLIDYIEEINWSGFKQSEPNTQGFDKLEPRVLPSFPVQLWLLTKRSLQQVFRDARSLIILFILTVISSLLIGLLYHKAAFIGPPSKETIGKCPEGFQFLCAQNQKDTYMVQALLICLSLGLTAGSSSLSFFGGTEKLLHARECVTGQSNIAYYVAKMIAIIPHQILAPLLFISIFHLFTQPAVGFWDLFVVALGIYDVCVNISILSSILLADSRALTVSVVTICLCNVLSGFNPRLTQLQDSLGGVLGRALPALSYSRWGIELFYLSVVGVYQHVYDINIALHTWGYSLGERELAIVMPFVLGGILRLCSAIAIVYKGK